MSRPNLDALWHVRLRYAVDRTHRKHGFIASQAGIAPATLSRILNGHHPNVSFETMIRIARATGVRVGWLVGEPVRGVELSDAERNVLGSAAAILTRIVSAKR